MLVGEVGEARGKAAKAGGLVLDVLEVLSKVKGGAQGSESFGFLVGEIRHAEGVVDLIVVAADLRGEEGRLGDEQLPGGLVRGRGVELAGPLSAENAKDDARGFSLRFGSSELRHSRTRVRKVPFRCDR